MPKVEDTWKPVCAIAREGSSGKMMMHLEGYSVPKVVVTTLDTGVHLYKEIHLRR